MVFLRDRGITSDHSSLYFYKWKNHFFKMKGDGLKHQNGRNKGSLHSKVAQSYLTPSLYLCSISNFAYIRESVDSLYRDDTDEISRDPRTKRLKTRRESLPRPSKHTSNSLRAHIYLYMFPKTSYAPSVLHARLRSYAISRFSCHHILHLLLLLLLLLL